MKSPLSGLFLALGAAVAASVLTLLLADSFQDGKAGPEAGVAAASRDALTVASPTVARPNTDTSVLANETAERLDNAIARLTLLEDRIQELASPRASVLDEDMLRERATAAGLLPEDVTEAQKLVLTILQQKEDDDARAREEEARRRNEERLLARADQIAEKLGLARADRDALHTVLLEESVRRSELFDAMRNGDNFNRETVRAQMETINEWKQNELTTRFGTDLAGQINESDDGGGFGRRGGGRAVGGTGGGGRNGGGGGGRGGS